jgi:hypothetical protein
MQDRMKTLGTRDRSIVEPTEFRGGTRPRLPAGQKEAVERQTR